MSPKVSSAARAKWGDTSFRQLSRSVVNGSKVSGMLSGYLLQGDGTDIGVEITAAYNGASFGFDSKGGNIVVTLPAGELTQDGQSTVTISGYGSLTKVNGEWLYVG